MKPSTQLRSAAAALACLLLAASACNGRRALRKGSETLSGFDYYVLALSWAPAFCAHENASRPNRECELGRDTGFVVHGLWPERETGAPLENCAPVEPVPGDIVQRMLPLIPSSGMIQHEWRTHGSCSGLSAPEYFATLERASQRIQIPNVYRHVQHTLQTSPGEIERRFAAANDLRGVPPVRVQCRQGELREVRICLSKTFAPAPVHLAHEGLPRRTVIYQAHAVKLIPE